MLHLLARNWWALVLRGIAGVVFGIMALVWPHLALAVLVLLFGVYALVDGVFTVFSAAASGTGRRARWVLLLEGLIGILAGVLTLTWPAITAVVLLFFIAIWAVATGILKIAVALQLREMIGIYAILFGLTLVTLGFRLRGVACGNLALEARTA